MVGKGEVRGLGPQREILCVISSLAEHDNVDQQTGRPTSSWTSRPASSSKLHVCDLYCDKLFMSQIFTHKCFVSEITGGGKYKQERDFSDRGLDGDEEYCIID